MTPRVPRLGRLLDLAGALVFLAGALVYARSWLGLRAMDRFERDAGATPHAAVEHADAMARLGSYGFALMAAGAVIAVLAALVARRMTRNGAAAG